jgi:hypothetical protein
MNARSELLRASREAPAALLLEGALSPRSGRVGNAVAIIRVVMR